MRKFFTIILISVHLTGNTEVGQLLKLPQLLSHYYQHHHQDPSVDFIEFIAMHYAGDDGTTADDDMDNKLPCHNITHNTFAVSYSPMVKEISTLELPVPEARNRSSHLQLGIPTGHVSLILQPPRPVAASL